MFDPLLFLPSESVALISKIALAIPLLLYAIFALILFNKTRSLSRIVFIQASSASLLLEMLALFHLLAVLLLFLVSIAIL
jgi:hypothetical protein